MVPDAIHIDRPDDARVAAFADIRERELATRDGLFVGETLIVLEAMLLRTAAIRAVVASPRMLGRTAELLAAHGCSAPLYTAEDSTLEALTGIDLHRGVLAVAERAAFEPASIDAYAPARPPRTVLVCEDINNIDNIGQLFRNAAAFGCACVLLSPSCHDPLYRKSLRVSCGHALRVPFARSADWAADLAWLRDDAGFAVVGATGRGACTLAETARSLGGRTPRRIAVLVGAEFAGLGEAALAACTHRARIPMAEGVDSLNVGVAAGVFLARLAERPPAG